MKGKNVAKVETKAPVKKDAGAMAVATGFEADAGSGFEQARGKDSYALPIFAILQPLSPQVQKGRAEYIKGAEAGQIINTVTNELFESIDVVPVHYTMSFLEWVPRNKGGGFRGEHPYESGKELHDASPVDPETNKRVLKNGNHIVDTRNHYVLVMKEDGAIEPGLISMASSQIKQSRRWMTMMGSQVGKNADGKPYQLPSFANVWTLSTAMEQNEKGTWYAWRVALKTPLLADSGEVAQARIFKQQAASSAVVVNREVDTTANDVV